MQPELGLTVALTSSSHFLSMLGDFSYLFVFFCCFFSSDTGGVKRASHMTRKPSNPEQFSKAFCSFCPEKRSYCFPGSVLKPENILLGFLGAPGTHQMN